MKKTILLVLILALGMVPEVVNADFTFGTPTNLGPPVNSAIGELGSSITADGLQLYFLDYPSRRPGGYGNKDIWVTTRSTKGDPWGEPVNLGPIVNSSHGEDGPSISADGLMLYFSSNRPGGQGGYDIWVTTRETRGEDWGHPVNLGPPVNTSSFELGICISPDGLQLYFDDYFGPRPGGQGRGDLWVTTRATVSDPWGVPVNLGPTVNGSSNDICPNVSADGRTLFFSSTRPGGSGGFDMWVTTRPTTSHPWGTPVNLGPTVNSSDDDECPAISADGSTLNFSSRNRPGGFGSYDLWQAPVLPMVDFTGDYTVDIKDLILLIEHWGQTEPSVDMAPMPWGDGVVDAQDLEVLMSNWGKELYDPHFLAYWKMDETVGDVAYDSVGGNDAVVIGDAVWQPEGGQVGGALQLDGIDDYLNTLFVLNPADTVFSVFAWIKGGGPGQVILSQSGGANWLMLDAQGFLKTTLKGSRREKDLTSAAAIMGDSWHRVGFTWDGNDRVLYVDDNEVARDTQGRLQGSRGDLTIGAGNNLDLDPGAFWSGLIDDVRLYDRVVTP